jgi:hypothetical protein
VIAYNLGNLSRRLVLPEKVEKWSLTSTRRQRRSQIGNPG